MGSAPSQRREIDPRTAYLVASIAIVCVPVFAVEYIPSTDLPQHVAQIRLLKELWGLSPRTVDTSLLIARPVDVNTFVYWPLFLLSHVVGPRVAGKLTVALILASAVVATHHLARKRDRAPIHALVATLPLFSAPLYWGFLNFLSGVPLWLLFTARAAAFSEYPRTGSRLLRTLFVDALMVAVLLWAHLFWAVVAGLTAVLCELPSFTIKRLLARCCAFVPTAVYVVLWLPGLANARRAAGFSLQSHYLVPLHDRLSFEFLTNAIFGGVRGWLEPIFTSLIVLYFVAVSLSARRQESHIDRTLMALGSAMLAFGFLAPDQYMNTILLNRRFIPIAVILLLVALPVPRGKLLRVAPAIAAALFSLATTFCWTLFDQLDLSGLRESFARMPAGASILSLHYRPGSALLRDRPFLQIAAYAQAEHGGELAFSFAEHASSIVAYRNPRRTTWTPGLEWLADRAKREDVAHFDCILVNGLESDHVRFRALSGRTTPIKEGFFRSYCR